MVDGHLDAVINRIYQHDGCLVGSDIVDIAELAVIALPEKSDAQW